ncbi:hypothetical protein RRG08_026242 [Elysia crispata]|uniref:Uncharacterized protein n=1 Tax=Elysia crispata TaxID=231223 RepID=A0AAE0ZBA9_9GAST|nr:hypothetical protein RRG08_026242 [Elysia crispata]
MDKCNRDLKTCRIQPAELEAEVSNHTAWRAKVTEGIKSAEEKREPADIRGHSPSLLLTPFLLLTPLPPLTTPAASANAAASPE